MYSTAYQRGIVVIVLLVVKGTQAIALGEYFDFHPLHNRVIDRIGSDMPP